jgi:YVTN family beta-propeller protein
VSRLRPPVLVILLILPALTLVSRPLDSSARPGALNQGYFQPSRSIAVTPDGALVLAVNPDSGSLSLVDATTLDLLAELPVGRTPQSVAVAPDGAVAYVTNKGSNTLSVIDLSSREAGAEIAVGDRPVGVAISPDGQFIALTEMGADQVRIIMRADRTTLATFAVDDRPYGITFTPDGRFLLVSHLLSGQVTVLSFLPQRMYLPSIREDLSGLTSSSTGRTSPASEAAAQLTVRTIQTWPDVAPAPAILVNDEGTRAYLPQTMANGQGLDEQFDRTVFPKVSVLNLESWSHQVSEHVPLPETDRPVGLPWDVALAQDGSELWVVNSASNDISIVDISNPSFPKPRAHIAAGDNPRGIAFSPDGRLAFVNNTLSGTISVIEAATYTVVDEITLTKIPLPPLILNGKRLFFSSASSELARAAWISCNTCHIEGEQDGRTWRLHFLGEVPPGEQPLIRRNTTSLLGMIETYPLRWSAEWDESADSEFSVRFEQFGTGLISGGMNPTLGAPNQGRSYDLDSLAAYIDGLALPARSHTLSAAENRGREIFFSPETACAHCHPPPLYTDQRQHDVGTAEAPDEWFGPEIDTPSLRSLYDSQPYLHDGSATTLLDLLVTKNAQDEHGVTSHLSSQELADLIAFLLALPY